MSYYAKGLPWASGIGTNVTDCETSREVMEQAKLDFTVKKCELVAKMPFMLGANNELDDDAFVHKGQIFRDCPNAFATYRTDLNIPLGIVKERYEVVQNVEAFEFFNEAIGEGNAEWTRAGLFGYGHKVFITAKIKHNTDVNGDPIENYLVFSNSHDGSQSIDIMFTPVRVACTNMLAWGFKQSDSHIRIRHTKTVKEKLEETTRVLKIACEYADSAHDIYNALSLKSMDDIEVIKYFSRLLLDEKEYAIVNELDNIGFEKLIYRDYHLVDKAGISARKLNQLTSMYDYYKYGVAQKDIVGTAWGAYNAVTGYYCNVANLHGEKRMASLLYGNANKVMVDALNMAA